MGLKKPSAEVLLRLVQSVFYLFQEEKACMTNLEMVGRLCCLLRPLTSVFKCEKGARFIGIKPNVKIKI